MRKALRARRRREVLTGVSLVDAKTNASFSKEKPASRCRIRASTALAVSVVLRLLSVVFGESKEGDPRPATRAWRICRVRWVKSRLSHRSPSISPRLMPLVKAKQQRAWYLSPSARIRNPRASFWSKGRSPRLRRVVGQRLCRYCASPVSGWWRLRWASRPLLRRLVLLRACSVG